MQYGLLSYHNTFNLGDEIQSIAARQFLPQVDVFVNRDGLASVQLDHPTKLICNGWFSHRPSEWPPNKLIYPLLTSFHLNSSPTFVGGSAADFILDEAVLEYLRANGPVGARDLHTLDLLEKCGVPSYFSGCLTLTLPKTGGERRNDLIVLCDVPDSVVSHIRRKTKKEIQVVGVQGVGFDRDARMKEAEARLRLLEQASCVITGRLHAALPCLPLGTPVFMVDIAEDQYRFRGLHDLIRHGPPESLLSDGVFDVNDPVPNSYDYLPLAQTLKSTVQGFINSDDKASNQIDFQASRINALTTNLAASARKIWELEGLVKRLETHFAEMTTGKAIEAMDGSPDLVVNENTRAAEMQLRLARSEADKLGAEAQVEMLTQTLADVEHRLSAAEAQRATTDETAALAIERIDYLETEVARGAEELAQIRLIHSGIWTVYRELQARSEVTTLELKALRSDLEDREAEIGRLRHEIAIRDHQLGGANGHIHALLNSSSWRITAPLRKPKELMLLRQSKSTGDN